MSFITTLEWILYSCLSVPQVVGETCNDAFSCTSIENEINETLHCSGYKSCFNNELIGTSYFMRCGGSYSCNKNGIIRMSKFREGSEIICQGDRSCANTTIYSTQNVNCRGFKSCSNTNIIGNHNNTNNVDLWCQSSHACSNSNISGITTIYPKGSYTLLNSFVSSKNTFGNSTNIAFGGGYLMGYNVTFKCEIGHTCSIDCRGNSCLGTYFDCNNSLSTCIVDCNETEYRYCPKGSYYNSNNSAYNNNNLIALRNDSDFFEYLYDDIDSIYSDDDCYNQLCDAYDNSESSLENVYICDDYQQCNGTDMTVHNRNNSLICCRGRSSCPMLENIMTFKNNDNVNVICSGLSGCENARLQIEINDSYSGSNNKNNNNNNNVIICSGGYSCYTTTFLSSISMYNSRHVKIYCIGGWSCWNGVMSDIDALYCGSFESCKNVMINGISNLYLASWGTLKNSIIYSEGTTTQSSIDESWNKFSVMNVYIMAESGASNTMFYCNESSICNFYCVVNSACDTTMKIICFGHCNIDCSYSNGVNNFQAACPDVTVMNNGSVSYNLTYTINDDPVEASITTTMTETATITTTTLSNTTANINTTHMNPNKRKNGNNGLFTFDFSSTIFLIVTIAVSIICILITIIIIIMYKWKSTAKTVQSNNKNISDLKLQMESIAKEKTLQRIQTVESPTDQTTINRLADSNFQMQKFLANANELIANINTNNITSTNNDHDNNNPDTKMSLSQQTDVDSNDMNSDININTRTGEASMSETWHTQANNIAMVVANGEIGMNDHESEARRLDSDDTCKSDSSKLFEVIKTNNVNDKGTKDTKSRTKTRAAHRMLPIKPTPSANSKSKSKSTTRAPQPRVTKKTRTNNETTKAYVD